MITGAICLQEVGKSNVNVLNEFANFNQVHVWNKSAGGSNAAVLSVVGSGRYSYLGIGSVKLDFTGTGQVSFNAGSTQMERSIQKTGNFVLSYAFNKSNPASNITFIVEMYVNAVLVSANTVTQTLNASNGFVDGQWNTFYQNVALSYGDVVDFAFKAQSDTAGCQLYFDRLELESDDRGSGAPTIYTEAPLDQFSEESNIDIPSIPAGGAVIVTAALTGAELNNSSKSVVGVARYPEALIDSGLVVGVPLVTASNKIKFMVMNPTASAVNPISDTFLFKLIR